MNPQPMRIRIFLLLSLLVLSGLASETAQASTTLNLKDFGAIGNNVANDGPALQQALDALAQAGGGTLFVPKGTYAIITPVARDFTGLASSITILGVESLTPVDITTLGGTELPKGLDLVSEFTPKTGPTQTAIRITGLQSLLINHITFLGTYGAPTDAKYSLLLEQIEDATIRHCEFYGLGTWTGAVIMATQSRLKIDQSKFLGCAGSSGTYLPIVQNLRWKGITVTGTAFVDFGLRALFSKTPQGMPISWINIGNAEAVTNDSPRREVVIRNVFLDEGSYLGITSLPYLYTPMTAPIDLVYITGLRENVNNAGGHGNHFDVLRALFIEKSRYEWSKVASSAINLRAVGNVILDEVKCLVAANRINATTQTGRLTVVNSIYTYLNSSAQVTRVVTTATPAEDPVQYVRQQYSLVLGREPDPAGHYYWSDLLLRCEDNSQCEDAVRAKLATYLGQLPSPNFSIEGQVTGVGGQAMPGVTVKLSGSQAVSTVTDVDGQYHFSGLPTSGSYTVTPSLKYYSFQLPSRTFNNPAADQSADFVGKFGNLTISGDVTKTDGKPLSGVNVTLAGRSTTTDALGHYSFTALAAAQNYTLALSKTNYDFTPTGRVFNDLSADQSANFTASLRKYVISGRVLTGTAGLSGVAVTLSGTQSGVATTDANGGYSFTVPATGNYTLTPAFKNYTFNLPARSFTNLSSNQTADFAATGPTFTISGRVRNLVNTVNMAGVTITLSGSQTGTTLTDANGFFSFQLPEHGNYTLTPSLKHYSFTLPSLTFNPLSANQFVYFGGRLNIYKISGVVKNPNGTPLSGVYVRLSGRIAVTDAQGNYSFGNLGAGGNYILALSKTNYSFTPSGRVFNDLGANQTANFTGALASVASASISPADSTRAFAFDLLLQMREQFQLMPATELSTKSRETARSSVRFRFV